MINNGLVIYGNFTPVIKNSRIHHCTSSGVTITSDPPNPDRHAIFENCIIEENDGINVRIANASPIFRDCKIINAKGRKSAIYEYEVYERNGLQVTGACLWVAVGGNPSFINCQFASKYEPEVNSITGVGFEANASFEDCIFDGDDCESGILVLHHKGKGTIKKCTIKNSKEGDALFISSGAVAAIDDSVFESNKIGLICSGDGEVTIKNCSFKNNGTGVAAMREGYANVSNCRFIGHSDASIFMKEQARGTFENNEIIDGKQFGVLVRSEEPIVFRSNVLKNNTMNWLIQCSGKQLQRVDNEPNE